MAEEDTPTMTQQETIGLGTTAIHSGLDPDTWRSRAIVTPIVTSNNYKQDVYGDGEDYLYSRLNNPTRQALETNLAALEGAKYGLVFSSGLGALSTLMYLLKSGDHVVVSEGYGGTHHYFRHCASQFGLSATFVDGAATENYVNALQPTTRLVWLETPTNPTMKLVDIQEVTSRVKEVTAHWQEQPFVVVDNTFMSSYFQRPLHLGADVVMHSISKYMNGHSDVIMGALILNDEEKYNKLYSFQGAVGATPSPFDCYLVLRGLKTLPVRMREHQRSALEVARYLETHPGVSRVMYPGLASHPQHDLARRQMDGYSGILSFYVAGQLEDTKTFISQLKYVTHAASLGGFESLCEIPMMFSQRDTPPEQREARGITGSLVRLSVGLEDVEDLTRDLGQALDFMLKRQQKTV